MKFCNAIDIEVTPAGAVYKGARWPAEIAVERGLLEFAPGPHAQFGRRGALAFNCVNGAAVYRRFEERAFGWLYKLVQADLQGAARQLEDIRNAATTPTETPQTRPREESAQAAAPPSVGGRYRYKFRRDLEVEAFQWLPHVMPARDLPQWFMRARWRLKNKEGELIIQQRSGGKTVATQLHAEPSDWIVLKGDTIAVCKAKNFSRVYVKAEATA